MIVWMITNVLQWYAAEFDPERVAAAAAKRVGACHRCGACCGLTLRCAHLERVSASEARCRVYGRCQPAQCGAFPLDRRDLAELAPGVVCGFAFADARAPALPLLRAPSAAGLRRFVRVAPRVVPRTLVRCLSLRSSFPLSVDSRD